MAFLTKTLIHHIDDRRRQGKTESFATAALGQDERVNPDKVALDVNERSAAVSWIDRSVRLYVGDRGPAVGLPGDGTDDPHRRGIFQTERTPDSDHQFSLCDLLEVGKRQRR